MILVSNPKFSLEPIDNILNKIESEFDGWEILAEKYHGWNYREEVTDALSTSDLELQLHSPLNDINIASINPNIREASVKEIKKSIDLANMLDVEIVTVHPGLYSPLSRYTEDSPKLAKESLRELNDYSNERSVTIALENLPSMWLSICDTAEEISDFLREVDLEFCLDIGHAYTAGEVEKFLDLEPVNVHLHDNRGENDLHLPLGEGEIDFQKIISELKDYEGNYVIEGRDLEELKESKIYLQNLLEND